MLVQNDINALFLIFLSPKHFLCLVAQCNQLQAYITHRLYSNLVIVIVCCSKTLLSTPTLNHTSLSRQSYDMQTSLWELIIYCSHISWPLPQHQNLYPLLTISNANLFFAGVPNTQTCPPPPPVLLNRVHCPLLLLLHIYKLLSYFILILFFIIN